MAGTLSSLSISSKTLNNCDGVANLLALVGIECKILNTKCVVRDKRSGQPYIEPGCDILICENNITKTTVKNIWDPLRKNFGITCGYLNITGAEGYCGCIWDYLRKSNCPRA